MKSEQQVIVELEKYLQSILEGRKYDVEEFVSLCAKAPLQRENQIAFIYLSKSSLVTDDFKKTPIIKIGKNELCLNDISSFEVGALGEFLNNLSTRKAILPARELQATVANNHIRKVEDPFYCDCTFEQALTSDVCMGRSGKMDR